MEAFFLKEPQDQYGFLLTRISLSLTPGPSTTLILRLPSDHKDLSLACMSLANLPPGVGGSTNSTVTNFSVPLYLFHKSTFPAPSSVGFRLSSAYPYKEALYRPCVSQADMHS